MNATSTPPQTARRTLRHPIGTYFALVYLLSAVAAVIVYGPTLLGHDSAMAQLLRSGAIAFPFMVIGVAVIGITLTSIAEGKAGRRALRSRMRPGQAPARWYLMILIPPAAILIVLGILTATVSPAFAPGLNPYGLGFGLLAGFCEETGWTGYLWPRLRPAFRSTFAAGATLGVAWGLWHVPVIDHLGVHPHGGYWALFALAFITAMTALRVLITWTYTKTGSLLVAQLTHAASTGFLVLLSPLGVSPGQETLWYFGYAALLWLAVGIVTVADRGHATA